MSAPIPGPHGKRSVLLLVSLDPAPAVLVSTALAVPSASIQDTTRAYEPCLVTSTRWAKTLGIAVEPILAGQSRYSALLVFTASVPDRTAFARPQHSQWVLVKSLQEQALVEAADLAVRPR